MNMINIVVNPLDDDLRYVGIKAQIFHHIINEIQRLKEDNYKLSSESRVLGLPVSRGNKQ
jgi:hypothetical protein